MACGRALPALYLYPSLHCTQQLHLTKQVLATITQAGSRLVCVAPAQRLWSFSVAFRKHSSGYSSWHSSWQTVLTVLHRG